jgi:hypothetical protein
MTIETPRPPRIDGLPPEIALQSLSEWLQTFYDGNFVGAIHTSDEAYQAAQAAQATADTANARTSPWKTGTLTISDAATSGTFAFDTVADDVNYSLIVAPSDFTGTPAAGSGLVTRHTMQIDGFTIDIDTAPGVGNSVTFNWLMTRGINA